MDFRSYQELLESVDQVHGQVADADACISITKCDVVRVWFTDPPYYDAVPYADLSDFFFVWLKRTLPDILYAVTHLTSNNP